MDNDAQKAPEEDQKQPLGSNGLLQVTVTAYMFRKWHVDNETPYHERWFFLDCVSFDARGDFFFVRSWWAVPLDDLTVFEELDKIPLNRFLSLSSRSCIMESAEDFFLTGEEQEEYGPDFCLGMKAPKLEEIRLEEMGPDLIEAMQSFVSNLLAEEGCGSCRPFGSTMLPPSS